MPDGCGVGGVDVVDQIGISVAALDQSSGDLGERSLGDSGGDQRVALVPRMRGGRSALELLPRSLPPASPLLLVGPYGPP